ncbi:FliM/FliN family flagellar motor switch protein, partial [Acinetobacter baumannii]
AEVLALRAGDVLPIELPENVIGKVDGVPVMQCSYGTMNGQYALRVQRMFNHQDSDSNKETDHD